MTKLKSLPARKFVRRTRGGVPYFIYADPDYCKCAYVGTQAAMDTFRGMSARSLRVAGLHRAGRHLETLRRQCRK